MNILKFRRRAQALAPALALGALLIVTLIFENVAPPAMVNSVPENGADCYCHKGLTSILTVNGTDVTGYYPTVKKGSSFTLLIRAQFAPLDPSMKISPDVGFASDSADNSKFKFTPNDVLDNSPQDQDPTPNAVVALFTITAPNEADYYSMEVEYHGGTSTITVQVVSDTAGASKSFAAIAKVDRPMTSTPGDNVTINILLQNNRTAASKLFAYATNSSTKQVIFSKLYSDTSISPNGTISLTGSFKMPNGTLTLMIHSGHVEDGKDVNDDHFTFSVIRLVPPPPKAPISVLATEWAPWIAIAAVTLGSAPLVGTYTRKGKRLFSRTDKLKLAIVDCAYCGGCERAVADLGETLLALISQKIDLVYAPLLMSASEYGPVDVVFVVGSIRTDGDLEIAREARNKAKVLVAFGSCPAFGALNNLANLSSKEELLETAYANAPSIIRDGERTIPSVRVPGLINKLKPLSDYVKVDITLPGCPPPADAIKSAFDALLELFSSGDKKNER